MNQTCACTEDGKQHKQVINETRDKYSPKYTCQHKSPKGNEAVGLFRYVSQVKIDYTAVLNLFTLRLAQYDPQSCPYRCFNLTYSNVTTTSFQGSCSKEFMFCRTTFIVTPLNFSHFLCAQTDNKLNHFSDSPLLQLKQSPCDSRQILCISFWTKWDRA